MSLKGFHLLFISASVLLALGMGAWCLREHKAAAVASFVAAGLLVAYESWFIQRARRLP